MPWILAFFNFSADCSDGTTLNLQTIFDVILFIPPLAAELKVFYTVQQRIVGSCMVLYTQKPEEPKGV